VLWDSEDLERWAMPQNVLLPEEGSQRKDYLDLYAQQLEVVCAHTGHTGACVPPVANRHAALRRAACIWDHKRITIDMRDAALKRRANCKTRMGERQERFSDAEMRRRLDNAELDELDEQLRFASICAGAIEEVEVIPLPTSRRRG
jgi:hypothetical protein